MTRMELTHVVPMTVQNIMLEHMEASGLSRKAATSALIGIALEMQKWDFVATDKQQ